MKPHARHSIKWEAPLVLPVLPVVILFVILGCAGQAAGATAAVDSQATFATPVEAGEALQAAARADNEVALTRILGPRSKAILSSGDPDEDKASLQSFVIKYDRMNRWVAMTDSSQVLYIGADNYPYPIPLVQNSSSKWYFNTSAGEEEILARRIGRMNFGQSMPVMRWRMPKNSTSINLMTAGQLANTPPRLSAQREDRMDFIGPLRQANLRARSATWPSLQGIRYSRQAPTRHR